MTQLDGIKVGQAAYLIRGLDSTWSPADGKLNALYPPAQAPLQETDIGAGFAPGTWSYPSITLHEDAQSLLSELLPYDVKNPSSDIHALGLPAGALVLGAAKSSEALAQLSVTLGVDLTNPDLRYALVKLTRTDGCVTHASAQSGVFMHVRPRTPDPEFGITREFFKAMTRLRHRGTQRLQDFGTELGIREATSILTFFKEWGTHFVSEVEVGDTILQVFAYPSQRFKQVKAAYAGGSNPLQGPGATDFAYYTTDFNQGPYGYVTQYGKILNFSNAAAFQQSLAAGAWKDAEWARTDSVFALFNDRAPLTLSEMNQRFTESAPIRIQLTTLALFVEFKRTLFWERVLKGAFVQKYEASVDANFAIYDQRNFVTLLPEDQPGVLSTIATPSINVYKAYLDIGDLQMVAADQVKDFTAFANVLTSSAKQPVDLPGQRIRLLGQVLDMRTTGQPRTLVVADSAFDTLELACDEFLGALALRNRAASKYSVIVDGLRYGLSGQGRDAEPIVVSDVRQVPSAAALPSLIDSLQFSMAFAEAVVSDQSACANDEIQLFVRRYLRWLARLVPAQTTDPELLALRVRALDLANYAMNPSYGSFVPILPYSDYQAYVERILELTTAIQQQIDQYRQEIARRKQAELIINVAETLNKNIIASGDLISKVIAANAAQQKDMEGYYDSLITQQKAEADGQLTRVGQLEGLLLEQQAEVDFAVQKYKSAVQRWEAMEAIKFGLEVATSLFDLGTTIALPSSTIGAVEKLGKKVQMIQKIFNVLNATWKVYSGIKTEVEKLVDAQKTLDGLAGAQFGSPSTLSWDELSLNFNEILSSGPSGSEVDAAKAHLENAFGVLILRGKALAGAKSSLHQLQRDIYTSQLQKELNARQAARLDALNNALRPASIEQLDRSEIDLVGLTGNLGFIQNQMLTILAKAFQQQDQALQYAYLQPPTPISSFSLLKFRSARVKQARATIEAKSTLAKFQTSITTPIHYVVEGVHPEQITNGNVLSCTIPLSARELYEYVDARVVSVVATVEGIRSTDGGDYLVRLAYEGTPFHDRDTERNALTFRTPRRERVYQYDATTGAPRFTDGGKSWSEGVSRVTPFSTWQVTLPKTQINKGITFDSAEVTVRLSFVLEARIVDAEVHQRHRLQLLAGARGPGGRPAPLMDLAQAGALPSVSALVAQMSAQGACTNNWDVVFNLSLQQINAALHQQYDALKASTSYKNVIDVQTRTPVIEGVWAIKKFHIEYGYPSLTFLTNNSDTARLEMQILSGSIQSCIQQGDNPPKCDPPKEVGGETLTANVKIGKVQGTIQTEGSNHNVLKVLLDMQTGAFTVSNIELSDEEKVAFNKAVKDYFVNNPVVFLINQLDLSQIPTLEDMKPNGFLFKPLKTPSGQEMLQLFIQTGSRALLDYSQTFLSNISEPIPQGEQCSLMLRTGLFFGAVLPQSLSKNTWALEGVNPAGSDKAWSGKFSRASVSGNVDLSKLDRTVSTGHEYGGSSTRYTYYIPGGNLVTWSLTGLTMAATSDGQMLLSGSQSIPLGYVEKSCDTYWPCYWSCDPKCGTSNLSTDVNVTVYANLPITVGGSGRDQTVKIDVTNQAVTVTGHLSGGGPSGSDDLAAQVNQQIRDQVPPQIAKEVNVTFNPISVFALKNLLFPSQNYIQFDASYVPGDLLLVGRFINLS